MKPHIIKGFKSSFFLLFVVITIAIISCTKSTNAPSTPNLSSAIVVTGANGTILRSTDQGVTFQSYPLLTSSGKNFNGSIRAVATSTNGTLVFAAENPSSSDLSTASGFSFTGTNYSAGIKYGNVSTSSPQALYSDIVYDISPQAINDPNGGTILAVGQNGLVYSNNGGFSFTTGKPSLSSAQLNLQIQSANVTPAADLNSCTAVIFDPENGMNAFAVGIHPTIAGDTNSTKCMVLMSTDGAATWTDISDYTVMAQSDSATSVSVSTQGVVAVATNTGNVYIGMPSTTMINGNITATTNYNWFISKPSTSRSSIKSVVFNPKNYQNLMAVSNAGLISVGSFSSNFATPTKIHTTQTNQAIQTNPIEWTSLQLPSGVPSNISLNGIAIDPNNSNAYIVGNTSATTGMILKYSYMNNAWVNGTVMNPILSDAFNAITIRPIGN